MIARIATSAALNRLFDYLVPAELEATLRPGMRVVVPFGRRTTEGFVLELRDKSEVEVSRLKPVQRILEGGGSLPPELVKLALWMSDYYVAPIETTLLAFLPAPVRNAAGTHRRERLVVELVPPSQIPDQAPKLTKRQQEVLEYTKRSGGGFLSGLCEQWHATPAIYRALARAGRVRIVSREEVRDPVRAASVLPTHALPLGAAQKAALDLILREAESPAPKPVLLFGVTASGKTEVYLQAIAAALEKGRGAIVLVPEIALTPQTIQRFAARFGDCVAVLHSALSDAERRDEWNRIRSGAARVVVGPRSAVLAPVSNLGLLIVDEEHEPSYKQEDAPRYHARDVAVMRGHLQRCGVVLGSATPSLESWRNAQTGKYLLAQMRERVPGAMPPATQVVDTRPAAADAVLGEAKGWLFSRELIDAVRGRLAAGEQVMLFLNRRGYSTSLRCPQCNHVETCESCGLAMTYHIDEDILRCHLCGTFREPPRECPECRSPDLLRRGIGTQRVEDIAKRLFPGAKIERMDADVTTRRHSHEEILARFRARKIDILVGTQMIAKGLDFPNVTLVGILNADAGLFIPDFRAAERTFQLVAQMAGRSGRGEIPGTVLVQTRSPEHPAIDFARVENYPAFADGELKERREAGFPPFTRVVCLTFRGADAESTKGYGDRFAATLRVSARGSFEVPDVYPSPLAQVRGEYRFQLLLTLAPPLGPFLGILRGTMAALEPPDGVRLAVDVDAVSLL